MPTIDSEAQLEDLLSEPTPEVVAALGRVSGDIIFLGVAGKMGPSLARMAKRASDAAGVRRRIIGVARFSTGGQEALEASGVETIRCDLLNESEVAKLPDAPNVVYMTGMKFGATGNEPLTWAMNVWLPGVICRRFAQSRIVAFSTGNVYGLTPVASGGTREEDSLQPVGEYAMSCLGRERMFEHFSRAGVPAALLRLNYACDLRYGVLVDLAQRVWARQPIDLSMGHFNTIWQGDANAQTLLALERVAAPAWIVNITGPELLSVRTVCEQFGRLLNRPVTFAGVEAASALLSNCSRAIQTLGLPQIDAEQLIEWVAAWVRGGGRLLGKPTHFEARDGRF